MAISIRCPKCGKKLAEVDAAVMENKRGAIRIMCPRCSHLTIK